MFRRGSITQIVGAAVVSFGFAMIAFRQQPYRTGRMNFIKIASEVQIFLIILLCVVIQVSDQGVTAKGLENVGTAQIAITIFILPITIAAIAQGISDFKSDLTGDLSANFRGDADNISNPMSEGLITVDSDDEDLDAED
jgi:hypothetical protein